MAIWLGLGVTILLLIISAMQGLYIGWPLIGGYAYFTLLNLKRGKSPGQIYAVSKEYAAKPFIVIPILLLIGAVISLWMASGTVGALVYYSLSFINPQMFIMWAFLLSALISMLLGTAFGAVGTIGVILMVLARGSGVDIYMTAGAIVSGIYVGDRCSPMSSSVYLLSSITDTDARRNLPMLLKSSLLPCALTAFFYFLLSPSYPLLSGGGTLQQDIAANFNLSWPSFLPALLMIAMAIAKIPVKVTMFCSALCGAVLAMVLQGQALPQICSIAMWGYHPEEGNALAGIIQGGGIWLLFKTSVILLAASCFTGVLEYADALNSLHKLLIRPGNYLKMYFRTLLVSILSISCGCNQTIGIILSGQLMTEPYGQNGLSNYDLARDVSYTAVPVAALIPWNTAVIVPMATLGLEKALHVPFMFYPWLLPLIFGPLYAWLGQKKRAGANL